MVDKYPVPKEASLQAIEESFTYSPIITYEQAKEIIADLKRVRKIRAAIGIYQLPSYSAQFLYEMLK